MEFMQKIYYKLYIWIRDQDDNNFFWNKIGI